MSDFFPIPVKKLKEFSTDENIESVVNKFYDTTQDLKFIQETRDKKYVENYKYLIELEKDFIENLSSVVLLRKTH